MTLEEKIKNLKGIGGLKLNENEYFLIFKPKINKSFRILNGLDQIYKVFSDNSETKITKKIYFKTN